MLRAGRNLKTLEYLFIKTYSLIKLLNSLNKITVVGGHKIKGIMTLDVNTHRSSTDTVEPDVSLVL